MCAARSTNPVNKKSAPFGAHLLSMLYYLFSNYGFATLKLRERNFVARSPNVR